MLAVNFTHVRHIEGIFITRATRVHIHLRGALLQHIQDQILGSQPRLQQFVPAMVVD